MEQRFEVTGRFADGARCLAGRPRPAGPARTHMVAAPAPGERPDAPHRRAAGPVRQAPGPARAESPRAAARSGSRPGTTPQACSTTPPASRASPARGGPWSPPRHGRGPTTPYLRREPIGTTGSLASRDRPLRMTGRSG
ncbi:hypothetical protein GCM10010246_45740 [Streptomyces cuspidosporus]|uniref:Uncharacterized protein n=1 Tax=Streptomyces cuspidosporus TaxID=66882 RepID=A0ABN3GJS5_9ACTN